MAWLKVQPTVPVDQIQLPVFAVLGKTVGFIRGIIFLKKLEKEKEVVQATQMRNGKYWMLVVVCQLEIE